MKRYGIIDPSIQVRGSAPIFWEQRGKLVTPKPRVSREVELTLPSLRLHLSSLMRLYGTPLVLSLLEQKGDEADLALSLSNCIRTLAEDACEPLSVRFCAFDLHTSGKNSKAEGARSLLGVIGTEAAAQVCSGRGGRRGRSCGAGVRVVACRKMMVLLVWCARSLVCGECFVVLWKCGVWCEWLSVACGIC